MFAERYTPKETQLLTRDQFREAVFQRNGVPSYIDGSVDTPICVVCGEIGQDAHHIIERRLWPDGGYYLANGATLCGPCHIKAETTEYSPEFIREKAGIKTVMMPPQYYDDDVIDKWGNYVLPNGQRFRGELFYDESVQKIIADYLPLFSKYVKYPRTYHLPWSPGLSKDDIILADVKNFVGKEVVVTEKLDGENTTLYRDHYHARSLDSTHHVSQGRAKAEHAKIQWDIPEDWRVVCENMFAKHSIEYSNLEAYLYGLSIWNEKNECLSWDETVEWFELFEMPIPPVLYRGIFDEKLVKALYKSENHDTMEGYVVRLTDRFSYSQFRQSVAKFVRENHVQTKHWKNTVIIPNTLRHGKCKQCMHG